jgi:hypothetical protein
MRPALSRRLRALFIHPYIHPLHMQINIINYISGALSNIHIQKRLRIYSKLFSPQSTSTTLRNHQESFWQKNGNSLNLQFGF